MTKLFLRCSFLKCREQTLVESVIVKCLPVSLRIACSHCALKLVSVGMLKNPTFSPFGPVVPFWLQSGIQQYRFCGDLFSFMVKKGTLYNHALNYTTLSSAFFSARILTRLVFKYSYRGLPEPSAIMNSVYNSRHKLQFETTHYLAKKNGPSSQTISLKKA